MEYVLVKDKPLSSAEAKAYVDYNYGPNWKKRTCPPYGYDFVPGHHTPNWPFQDHAALVAFMVKANG